jgi:hypothetical protein
LRVGPRVTFAGGPLQRLPEGVPRDAHALGDLAAAEAFATQQYVVVEQVVSAERDSVEVD